MVFAIFLTVALQASVAGSLLEMMHHQRMAQRAADEARLTWVGEAVINRTLQLFEDYMAADFRNNGNQGFPTLGTGNLVDGASSVTNSVSFSQYLSDWYSTFKIRNQYADALNAFDVNAGDIEIRETEKPSNAGELDQWRKYEIAVTARHSENKIESTFKQEIILNNGKLFNFSIFYNENLEISPGSGFDIQGPLFTNKNVYIMNNPETESQSNAVTLLLPDDYSTLDPEPYALSSAGNIYFFFNRTPALNYLLASGTYASSVQPYHIDPYGGLRELAPDYAISPTPNYPQFYYFQTAVTLASKNGAAKYCDPPNDSLLCDNVIRVESAPGNFINITPEHAPISTSGSSSGILSTAHTHGYNAQPAGSFVNVSSAMDDAQWPSLIPDPAMGVWNAANPLSDDPVLNGLWTQGVANYFGSEPAIRDVSSFGVQQKNIPIGDPGHPSQARVLIEPLTPQDDQGNAQAGSPGNVFPNGYPDDTAAVRNQKFQWKAEQNGINLYCEAPCDIPQAIWTSNIYEWVSIGRAGFGFIADYRIEAPAQKMLTIYIDTLLTLPEALSPDGLIIYVHTYPLDEADGAEIHTVKLANGSKLPEGGLTVATNGRLFIQGDYNTFDYAKGRDCTEAEWDAKDCTPPPAAVFSDSFGILSNDWSESYTLSTSLNSRPVNSDVVVNTALGTGFLKSQLKPRYLNCLASDMTAPGCEGGPERFACPAGEVPQCPNGFNPVGGDLNQCEYCQDPSTQIYYVNTESQMFKDAVATDIAFDGIQNLPNGGIPIAVDNVNAALGVRPFPGVYYQTLNRPQLVGESCICPGADTTCGQYTCQGNRSCVGSGENELCSQTCNLNSDCTAGKHPVVNYSRRYNRLYDPKSSGGLENLINLQEDWTGRNLRFLGTLSAPWTSTELVYNGQPAYWGETIYYRAPNRKFDFNENLKDNPPPGTPGVFSIKRGRWSAQAN